MSPEARPHLDRARHYLRAAQANVRSASWEMAALAAYTAAFHAAQVLIFERGRKTTKTHNGLKSELHRYARLEPAMDPDLVDEFGTAEEARHEALYGQVEMPEDKARRTLTWAEAFVADVQRVMG